MSPSSVGGVTSSAAASAAATNSTGVVNPKGNLGQDAFLKLLVAQLKYQDPMNPVQGADFIAQTAQFSVVEKLTEISNQNNTASQAQLAMQASSMIGKIVTYTSGDKTLYGIVCGVSLLAGQPKLDVAGSTIDMSAVSRIDAPPTP
jgi:flagellar basal-body rod modification protein FlgD